MDTTCKHYNLQQKGGNILKSTDRYFVALTYFPVVTTDPWLQWTYSKDTLQVHIYLPIYIFWATRNEGVVSLTLKIIRTWKWILCKNPIRQQKFQDARYKMCKQKIKKCTKAEDDWWKSLKDLILKERKTKWGNGM